jgi:hypothetical protein
MECMAEGEMEDLVKIFNCTVICMSLYVFFGAVRAYISYFSFRELSLKWVT